MRAKRATAATAPTLSAPETPSGDQALLTQAYKAGLIVGWKHDGERGYRLTLRDRRDEYVEIAKLSGYLDRLRRSTA